MGAHGLASYTQAPQTLPLPPPLPSSHASAANPSQPKHLPTPPTPDACCHGAALRLALALALLRPASCPLTSTPLPCSPRLASPRLLLPARPRPSLPPRRTGHRPPLRVAHDPLPRDLPPPCAPLPADHSTRLDASAPRRPLPGLASFPILPPSLPHPQPQPQLELPAAPSPLTRFRTRSRQSLDSPAPWRGR